MSSPLVGLYPTCLLQIYLIVGPYWILSMNVMLKDYGIESRGIIIIPSSERNLSLLFLGPPDLTSGQN